MKFFKKTFLIPFCFFNTKDYHQDAQNRRYPGQQKYKPVVFGKKISRTNAASGPTMAPLLSIAFCRPKLLPVSPFVTEPAIRLSRGAVLIPFPNLSIKRR